MTTARHKIWSIKVSRTIGSAPKLQTLPPTNEAFRENVARAHLQVAIWRHASEPNPPDLNPVNFGWMKDESSDALLPVTVPRNVTLAPEDVLKMIKCACESDMPCKTKRCGCHNANIACTVFCSCEGKRGCLNEKTQECLEADENTDSEDDNDSDNDGGN